MPTLHQQVFPTRLHGNDVRFTRNLAAKDLQLLIPPGRLWSRDLNALPGENAAENVRRVWEAIGLEQPKEFASIAVRSGADTTNVAKTLNSYGQVVVEVSPLVMAAEGVLFNGEVKNIGCTITETNELTWAYRIPFDGNTATLAAHLSNLRSNALSRDRPPPLPRLIGDYFEARLRRALLAADICALWVDPNDTDALQAANALCKSSP